MFLPISDYGVIGNLRTAALVNREGGIDWFCGPNFDSEPVFFPLLDANGGGCCRLVADQLQSSGRDYVENSAILKTHFKTAGGSFSVCDFMPVVEDGFAGEHVGIAQICRVFKCESGKVQVGMQLRASFRLDSTKQSGDVQIDRRSARCVFDDRELTIEAEDAELQDRNGAITFERSLVEGQSMRVLLTLSEPVGLTRHVLEDVDHLHDCTLQFWRRWVNQIQYDGPYRKQVVRSAITLKLCQFSATGAIVAAPTTSLPERIGAEYNWDYRFTWLRDATFTAVAILSLGLYEEAFEFLKFLHSTIKDSNEFRTLYTIFGKVAKSECLVQGVTGYRDSKPVRVGNAAAKQLQLDIFGELLHCIVLLLSHSELKSTRIEFERDLWPMIEDALDAVSENWQKADKGIWETRNQAKRFVYSQGMCLIAWERGIELAEKHGKEVRSGWRKAFSAARREFEEYAYDASVGSYVQAYHEKDLDASVLRLPMLGLLDPKDEKVANTISAIGRELMRNGFVLRNKNLDAGAVGEGAFLACSFWYADNLVMSGNVEEGRKHFERLLKYSNDLGLYSEEFDSRENIMLGNFPQAFTHIALINSAVQLAIAAKGHRSESHDILRGRRAGESRNAI